MTLTFPNSARSFDEAARRIRFLGHDGMFEIRFLIEVDALKIEQPQAKASERDYLAAFDRIRTRILEVAMKVYASKRRNLIVLGPADFR
jgi:hypothetical protein